ncbi:helix-turn-helix transcriptional regulator [Streptomyces goshikiensis]|uniref:helix-turn-helix domain-containing protein n=1 Tax=Streptomyces goshikiensis TaxID=1942 RepID=UPI003407B09C
MTRREISRYENGENVPTNYTIERIAVVCGVPPAPLAKETAAARARRRKRRKDAEEDPNDVNRGRMLEGVVAGATAAAVEPWSRLHQAIVAEEGSTTNPLPLSWTAPSTCTSASTV